MIDDLLAPEIVANPYPYLDLLRSEAPVHWSERHHAWLVTRYDDVKALLRDPRISSDRVTTYLAEKVADDQREAFEPIARLLPSWMVFKDAPEHRRLRGLVSLAFAGRMVERLSEVIERLVEELLARFVAQSAGDFIAEFAAPLPALVIAQMIGVPQRDYGRFRAWAAELKPLVLGAVNDPARHSRAREGLLSLEAYFRGLLAEARRDPRDDLLGAMIAAEDRGNRLTNDEVVGNLIFILFAGHETTTNLIASGVLALLRNPGELEKVVSRPDVVPSAVEEFLRYDSPSKLMPRYVAGDLELRGKRIDRGQRVFLIQAAANHDPERFERPHRLDVERPDNDHVAFGYGIHHCLGAPLARLEGNITFHALRRYLPRFEVASDDLRWHETLLVRALKALPLRVRPE